MLSLAMAVALLLPMTMLAQESRNTHGGMFGTNPQTESTGLMKGSGLMRSNADDSSLGNQAYGATDGGLTFDTFGETAPLGSGIAILLLAGAGYVALKKKED